MHLLRIFYVQIMMYLKQIIYPKEKDNLFNYFFKYDTYRINTIKTYSFF